MNKTGTFAAVVAVLGMALPAGAAGGQGHASACVFGKEARGCKLSATAYGEFKSRLIVGFATTGNELSLPVSYVCPQVTEEVSIYAKGKGTPRVGGSLSFPGKATVKSPTTVGVTSSTVKSAKLKGKLKISSAEKASLTGKVEVTLASGAKCSKKLPSKLLRVLGG